MKNLADHYVTQLLDTLQVMTTQDYAHVALALVLVGWAITRVK